MKQIDFFQNALANSVEILLNTEAQVQSHLKWLIESKRQAIENMAKGNVFNSDDICDFEDFRQRDIEHNVEMKAVAIFSEPCSSDIISRLKCRERNWFSNLFDIKVVFLRDPGPILASRAKLTKEEKKILKVLLDYYQNDRKYPNGQQILDLSHSLWCLKHKYNMAFYCSWSYGFNEVLDKDFLLHGLRVDNTSITKRRNKQELEGEE